MAEYRALEFPGALNLQTSHGNLPGREDEELCLPCGESPPETERSMRMGRAVFITLLVGIAVAGLVAPAEAAEHTVVATTSLTFEPAELTIQVGDTVTWTNNGGTHNVRADDGSFRCSSGCDGEGGDGSPSGANWSFSRTFNDPADIPYFCELHGGAGGAGMSGRLTVESGGTPPPDSDAIFSDGFESGDYCLWSDSENLPACEQVDPEPSGNFLRVSRSASRRKSGGEFGLESLYTDQPDGAFLIDETPDAIGRYLVTFWLQPAKDFSMARGATHVILEGRQRSNPRRVFTVSIEGQKKSKIFRVRVGAQTDSGFEDYGSVKIRRGKWSRVTLDWQAAEDGSSSGFVCLAKQAQCAKGRREAIQNPLLVIDSVRFGQVDRPDAGTNGTVYFDDFSSRTESPAQGPENDEEVGNPDGY